MAIRFRFAVEFTKLKTPPVGDVLNLVISPGIEPGLPGWEPGVLTVRRWDHIKHYILFGFDSAVGNRPPVIFFENAVGPASVGDIRHPASGLANCHSGQFSPGLPGWEPGVLTVRRWDHMSIITNFCVGSLIFCYWSDSLGALSW